MNGEYQTVKLFVDALNNSGIKYLVLRNYENMLNPELYMEGHGDIDLLCSEGQALAKAIGAREYVNNKKCGDGVHYYVIIAGQHVSVDLRSVGDGYYCKKWQNEMLERRVLNECFYVMDAVDYFYSLVYHSILQKRKFTEEYKGRLSLMAHNIGLVLRCDSEGEFIGHLESYMQKHGYMYTYPADTFVPLNTKLINKRFLERNNKLAFGHWMFDEKVTIIELLVRVKHFFQGRK